MSSVMTRIKAAEKTNPGLAEAIKPMKAGVGRKGRPNYKRALLVNIVGKLLPVSHLDWEKVAKIYMRRSGENKLRGIAHIQRYWHHICCDNHKIPTGETDGSILAAQSIYNQIPEKECCVDYGVTEEYGEFDDVASEESVSELEADDDDRDDASAEIATQLLQLAKVIEKTAEDNNQAMMLFMQHQHNQTIQHNRIIRYRMIHHNQMIHHYQMIQHNNNMMMLLMLWMILKNN